MTRPHVHIVHGGRVLRGAFVLLLAAAGLTPALHAQVAFNGAAALSSQLVDRGQAMTPDTPILQGAASWTFPAGWSLGLSGSTRLRSPGRLLAALAQASRHWALAGDWQMQANLLYYRYQGGSRSHAFDRAEAGLSWSYRDVLTFGLSAIHVIGGRNRLRGAADASLQWPLTRGLSLSAGAGIAQAPIAPYESCGDDRPGPSEYPHAGGCRHLPAPDLRRYGHLGLSWSRGAWRVEVQRILADRRTHWQSDVIDASPWVLTVSRSF